MTSHFSSFLENPKYTMTFPNPDDRLAFLRDAADHFEKSWKEEANSHSPDRGRIVGLNRSIAMALKELVEIHSN